MEEKKENKIWKVIKKILLIITSPIWYPWKLLFVRKEDNKFKNVDKKTKIFRIVRGFITKPLKFAVYLLIIALEITLVYKLRYSVLGYPLTKSKVRNYYASENAVDYQANEGMPVFHVSKHKDEFSKAFDIIDDWSLSEKNNMYVVLDSELVKIGFSYLPDENLSYILEKFNTDEEFREDMKYISNNINSILTSSIKDIKDDIDSDLTSAIDPIVNAGSYALGTRQMLDIAGTVGKKLLNGNDKKIDTASVSDVDNVIKLLDYIASGDSLKTAYDKIK